MFVGGLHSAIEGQLGKNVKKHTNHVKHNRNMVKNRFKTKMISNNNEQEKEVSCLTCCSILL